MHAPTPRENAPDPRSIPPEYQIRHGEEEVMNALVVEDSPQIAERLVELVSVPNRVEVSTPLKPARLVVLNRFCILMPNVKLYF